MAYQRWNLPPIFRHQMDVYEPPADPFDGLSSYRTAYVGRTAPVRPNMKPDDAAHLSAEPLDDVTTARAAYVRHPLPDVEPKQKAVWLPNPAGLDDLTNYRKEYTTKGKGHYVAQLITLRAKLSGAVYCNRSCLWVCLFVCVFVGLFVCLWVCYHDNSEIACIDLHQTGFVGKGSDHLQLIKCWPSSAPGKRVCGGAKIFDSALLQPARSICVSARSFIAVLLVKKIN